MIGERYLSSETICLGASFLPQIEEVQGVADNIAAIIRLRQEGDCFFFLFIHGEFAPTCIAVAQNTVVLDTEAALKRDWTHAKLATGVLPDFAVRPVKIWFGTNPAPDVEKHSTRDFFVVLNKYKEMNKPGMLWVLSGQDERFLFYPGDGKAIDQIVDISAGELVSDPIIITSLPLPENPDFSCAYFPFDANKEAWQEYQLHRYFCEISGAVLQRYGQLTGKVMTQSLERTVNLFITNYAWPIEFRKGHVIDQLKLSDIKQTQKTYQYILAHMFQHISLSVGKKLAAFLFGDCLNNASPAQRSSISSLLSNIDGFSSP